MSGIGLLAEHNEHSALKVRDAHNASEKMPL